MRDLTLFYLESCPFCKRARLYLDELKEENPAYGEIALVMVEEREKKKLADSFDYFYVPCFYLGEDKVAEGSIDKDGVRQVLDMALKAGGN